MPSVTSFRKSPATANATPAAQTPAPSAPAKAAEVVTKVPAAAKAAEPVKLAATPVAQPEDTAVATIGSTDVVPADFYNGVGGFEGEFTSNDIRIPYLSICGKTSKIFDEHPEFLGQFVYNKSIALGDEIRVVFAKVTKFWVEDLPFGTEAIPQRFKFMDDARAAGFNPSQMKEQAELDLLIELPLTDENGEATGVDEFADLFVGDKAYLLTRYTVQSSAYGKTVPTLRTDMGGFLKGNLVNGFYDIKTQKVEGKKGTYYVPVLKTDGPTPQELRTEIVKRCSPVAV
jgi:hypothetical protein